MPLPLPRQPEQAAPSTGAPASHYFDAAHGDVASLHDRIERSLGAHAFAALPQSQAVDRLEALVQAVSRAAGPIGLLGALAMIAYALI